MKTALPRRSSCCAAPWRYWSPANRKGLNVGDAVRFRRPAAWIPQPQRRTGGVPQPDPLPYDRVDKIALANGTQDTCYARNLLRNTPAGAPPTRDSAQSVGHAGHAAWRGRARQGGADRPAATGRGNDRCRPLCRCAWHASGAPLARGVDDRRCGPARIDRTGAAASGGAGNRSDCNRHAARDRTGGHRRNHPDRAAPPS